MINPKFRDADGSLDPRFDIVVANPMWNQPFDPDLFADDPFDRFLKPGGATTGKGDWAWLQHTLASPERRRPGGGRSRHRRGDARIRLEERGQGAEHPQVVRRPRPDRRRDPAARQPLLQHHAAGVIVVLSKRKPAARKGKIVLLNASRRVQKGRPKNYIPEEEIRPLAGRLSHGRAGRRRGRRHHRGQAEEADYNLSPSRWVGGAAGGDEADLGRP